MHESTVITYSSDDSINARKELFEIMKFDTFLSAEQAVEFGLADKIVTKRV